MDEIQILPAEPADFPLLYAMQLTAYATESLLYDEPIPPMVQSLAEAVADCERNLVLKACLDGRIIGSVRGRLMVDRCQVSRLMVLPEYRRLGVGTALLRALEQALPARHYELFTGSRSSGNIRLYQKLGYRIYREDPQQELVFLAKTGQPSGSAEGACAGKTRNGPRS
jgi:ribosomal protein S18 acetylase RimI-like enzyme